MKAIRASWWRYPAVVLLLITFVAVRWLLHPLLEDNAQLMLFILPVILAALIGDFYTGLLATFLSAFAGIFFFVKPYYSIGVAAPADFFHVIAFVSIGTIVSWLVEQLHVARGAAEIKAAEAEQEAIESRLAEETARESEQRFRYVADNAPVLIWLADTSRKSVWFNKPWLEFTGRTMEAELSRDWAEVIHSEDVERCWQTYNEAFDARREFTMEYRLCRYDNEYRWMLDKGVPRYAPDGEFLGFIGSCVDIHDRRQAESEQQRLLTENKQARAQAEVESRLKDEFVGTVSHELRTPLNAILGWTQMVRSGMVGAEQHQHAIEVIERNARAQAQLIEDLLDITRISTGKFRLNIQPVQLAEVAAAAIDTVRPAANAKEIEILQDLDRDAGIVMGDADRLQQVIWNLLSNAVKFSDKNGRIAVKLARVNSSVEIAVSDTGKGIEPEFLPYVFDRFRQQDSATTRKYGGLGLGLAIVKHIVELHGGTVRARSAGENCGATFIVQLPLRASEIEETRPAASDADKNNLPAINYNNAPETSIDLQGLKILVVDDEPDARDMLGSLLTIYGAEVTVCDSAKQVLSELPRLKPQVLISDIGMPNMNGYELIEKVRALDFDNCAQLPAIALTAFSRVEDRVRALAHGFQMFVPKPVEPSELVAAIKSLTGLTENLQSADNNDDNESNNGNKRN